MREILAMNQKERLRFHLLEMVVEERITLQKASEEMSVSYRQSKRLKSKFLKEGAKGLIHGNRGKRSPKAIRKEIEEQILKLSREKYGNFNDTHFTEKLIEDEGIKVNRETVRKLRRINGIKPKRRRRSKRHYKRRKRKAQEGMMILWDGSPHKWFGEKKPACCLMSAVDDATGQILDAFFVEFEGTFGYLKLLKSVVLKKGIPIAVYQDRHSSLKRNDANWTLEEQLANKQTPTQVGLSLESLGISPIFALSPQAKGRVERLFGVLQDRLIAEMELNKIKTIKKGNKFLDDLFIKDYNKRFAVKPCKREKAWRKSPKKSEIDKIVSFKYKAVVGNDNAVRIGGNILDIPEGKDRRGYAKAIVDVHQFLDGSWHIYYKGKLLFKNKAGFIKEPIRALGRKRFKTISKDQSVYMSSALTV